MSGKVTVSRDDRILIRGLIGGVGSAFVGMGLANSNFVDLGFGIAMMFGSFLVPITRCRAG